MTPKQKERELRARGFSEARIEQYMRDWKFHIPPTKSPHGRNQERSNGSNNGRST